MPEVTGPGNCPAEADSGLGELELSLNSEDGSCDLSVTGSLLASEQKAELQELEVVQELQEPEPVQGPGQRTLQHQLSQDLIDAPPTGWSRRAKLAILVCLIRHGLYQYWPNVETQSTNEQRTHCCCNVVFLELLVRQARGIGNLVTFAQFLLISTEGFIFTTRCGTIPPRVPFNSWLLLVVMYFLVSVTNNYALSYNIPMPLHMIFRAGSLLANMLMGMLILGKRYTRLKVVSVVMISLGIATCTLVSTVSRVSIKTGKVVFPEPLNDTEAHSPDVERYKAMVTEQEAEGGGGMVVGICLLTFALLLSARMGIYQEVIFSRWGKHLAKEALFYTHALPLPGFLLLWPDIALHWSVCLASEPLPALFGLPVMVAQLVCNVLLQYSCISAVFVLTTECTSLTASLVLTARKFVSLLFSIWYFQNPFTPLHWVGTGLVFAGILLFSDIPGYLQLQRQHTKAKKSL